MENTGEGCALSPQELEKIVCKGKTFFSIQSLLSRRKRETSVALSGTFMVPRVSLLQF